MFYIFQGQPLSVLTLYCVLVLHNIRPFVVRSRPFSAIAPWSWNVQRNYDSSSFLAFRRLVYIVYILFFVFEAAVSFWDGSTYICSRNTCIYSVYTFLFSPVGIHGSLYHSPPPFYPHNPLRWVRLCVWLAQNLYMTVHSTSGLSVLGLPYTKLTFLTTTTYWLSAYS